MLIIEKSKQGKNIGGKEKGTKQRKIDETVKRAFLQFKQEGSKKLPNPAAFAGLMSVYKQAKKSLKTLSKEKLENVWKGKTPTLCINLRGTLVFQLWGTMLQDYIRIGKLI